MEKMGRILRADGEAWAGQVRAFEVSQVSKSGRPGAPIDGWVWAWEWPVGRDGVRNGAGDEQQIPCGNDKKSKDEGKGRWAGFCGIPGLQDRKSMGTLAGLFRC